MKTPLIGFILTLMLSIGCIPTPRIGTGRPALNLETVSKTIHATAVSISIFTDTILIMHENEAIDRPIAEKLLDFALNADLIGLEASIFVRSLDKITPDDRQRLVKIVTPLLKSIDTLIEEEVIHIPRPLTQERVQTLLFIIRLTIINLGGF